MAKMAAVLAIAISLAAYRADAESTLLGTIDFPNSGSAEAQEAFLEGVLYLHNFEYRDAAEAFQRAQEIDSDFALAYWGEAMTYNHPLWSQQSRSKALDVLRKFGRTAADRRAKAPTLWTATAIPLARLPAVGSAPHWVRRWSWAMWPAHSPNR